MPDLVQPDPMGPEFGQPELAPIKKREFEVDPSKFQEEWKKKAVIVKEKERSDQAKEETREEKEAIRRESEIAYTYQNDSSTEGSILDVQKPSQSSSTAPPPSSQPAEPVEKSKTVSISADSSTDFSQDDSGFTQKLPSLTGQPKEKEASLFPHLQASGTSSAKEGKAPSSGTSEGVHEQAPQTGPRPLKTETSSSQGDGFPQEKQSHPSFAATPEQPHSQAPSSQPQATSPHSSSMPSSQEPEGHRLLAAPAEKLPITGPQELPKLPSQTTPPPLLTHEEEQTHQKPLIPETSSSESSSLFDSSSKEPPAEHLSPKDAEQKALSGDALFSNPFVVEPRKKDEQTAAKKDEEKEQAEGRISIQRPSEAGSSEQDKQEQEEKDRIEEMKAAQDLLNTAFQGSDTPLPDTQTPFQEAVGFDRMPAHILDLFDRLVGVIRVLQIQGMTETTLYINATHPDLQGVEVSITRFDTAASQFNIELKGPPQAANLLQSNVEQLKKAFKDPKKGFNFEVQNIKISLTQDETI